MRRMATGVPTAIVEQAGLLRINAGEQIDIDRVKRCNRPGAAPVPDKGVCRPPIHRSGNWRSKAFQRIGDPVQYIPVVRIRHGQPARAALSSWYRISAPAMAAALRPSASGTRWSR